MWRKFIPLFLFLLFLSSCDSEKKEDSPILKFGLIADIQYADIDTQRTIYGARYYRNSLNKLDECVKTLNAEQVEFTINLGDLIDRNPNDLPPVMEHLGRLQAPVHNIPGNHDYSGIEDNSALYRSLNMPAPYFSFVKENWRFIFLNTNEVATYANIKNTPLEQEHREMIQRIKKDKKNNDGSYNGGISKAQINWLKRELQDATLAHQNVLLFSHHPFYPEKESTALNDKEILDILSSAPIVKAAISGHHHPGGFGYYKQLANITLEGMVETEHDNSFAIAEIYKDKLVIRGKGRATSYVIPLNTPLPK